MLLASTLLMAALVVTINRLLWRRLRAGIDAVQAGNLNRQVSAPRVFWPQSERCEALRRLRCLRIPRSG
jgi:hypothetical protein